ncbi:MAG: T9SS type A sorting domain-containing protein [Bacteroidetes bacterium]|nr:T9SS type A sorting domain-containing protein [Bacteroidota bacterium]
MKYKLIFVFLNLLIVAFSQPGNIAKKYFLQNSQNCNSSDVIETIPNNYIVYGQTFDTVGNKIIPKITLIGLDQNANITWRKSYGDSTFTYLKYISTSAFFVKKNSYLYGALFGYDKNNFQPGVFIKFNYNGDTIWQKRYYVNDDQFFFTSVCPSADNGFLITGAVQTNTPGFNSHPIVATYLMKVDADGNKLWDKRFYKTNLDETQEGLKIIQDSITKKIVIVGGQDVGTTLLSSLIILDSLGNMLSQKGSNGAFGTVLIDIIKLKDGNFMAAGAFAHPEYVVNGYQTGKSYVVKFDLNGNILNSAQHDSLLVANDIFRIQELNDGTFITAGTIETLMIYGTGINNIFRIMKLDKNGNLLWKKYFDNYTNNLVNEYLKGMNITIDGSIIFTTEALGGYTLPSPYTFYKTDSTYCDFNSIGCYDYVGVEANKLSRKEINCYPNPASSFCILNFNNLNGFRTFKINLRNTLGQLLLSETVPSLSNFVLNTNAYCDGVYIISITENNHVVAEQKLIILK